MSSLTITIKGLDETIKYFDVLGNKKLPSVLRAGLAKSSTFVLGRLNNNTPVDTGRLKSSNKKIVGTTNALIGPDSSIAPYATWVEHGHHTRSGSWVPGQFFIRRTAIESTSGVQEIFNGLIKLALQ